MVWVKGKIVLMLKHWNNKDFKVFKILQSFGGWEAERKSQCKDLRLLQTSVITCFSEHWTGGENIILCFSDSEYKLS